MTAPIVENNGAERPWGDAKHLTSGPVLNRFADIEADALERIADKVVVVKGIGQRADAGLVALVADDERDAFLRMRR